MTGVGFETLARTPVPQLPPSYLSTPEKLGLKMFLVTQPYLEKALSNSWDINMETNTDGSN